MEGNSQVLRRKQDWIPSKVMNVKIQVEIRTKFQNREYVRNKLGEMMKKRGRTWQEIEHEVFGTPQIQRRGP